MTIATQKVLERLIYEGLLAHNQLKGRRWRMQLADMLQAGLEEPRILELLPAIIMHRPTLIWHLQRNMKAQPQLHQLITTLFTDKAPTAWMEVPIEALRKQAQLVQKIMEHRQSKQHWRNINIRVTEADLERLTALAQQTGLNKSDVIRKLLQYGMK
jgi:predicted DNA binding CopG/RHH family protein